MGIGDLPHIDAVLLTHDHYDHLDKHTVKALAQKAKRFIVSSGVERHLRRWGVPGGKITVLITAARDEPDILTAEVYTVPQLRCQPQPGAATK